MARKLANIATTIFLVALLGLVECAGDNAMAAAPTPTTNQIKRLQPSDEVESAVLAAAQASPDSSPKQEAESYQRVYEAFTKLMQNMSNNSLGNVRNLVSRLNRLVGGSSDAASNKQVQVATGNPSKPDQKRTDATSIDERTEQILNRLDKVNKDTDEHSLRQLNEDINKLVGTLSESYLRNIRRVIERVNKVVGQPAINVPQVQASGEPAQALHQSGSYLGDNPNNKLPGFPGWDELIVAMDTMQKSLAQVVRSSTRLITGTG